MKVEFLELAQFELEDSREYYDFQQPKLGETFKKDVQSAVDKIIELPKLYPEVAPKIRRCLLHRFPFSIIYSISNETIIILAIAHQARKPFYWIDRVQ